MAHRKEWNWVQFPICPNVKGVKSPQKYKNRCWGMSQLHRMTNPERPYPLGLALPWDPTPHPPRAGYRIQQAVTRSSYISILSSSSPESPCSLQLKSGLHQYRNQYIKHIFSWRNFSFPLLARNFLPSFSDMSFPYSIPRTTDWKTSLET